MDFFSKKKEELGLSEVRSVISIGAGESPFTMNRSTLHILLMYSYHAVYMLAISLSVMRPCAHVPSRISVTGGGV